MRLITIIAEDKEAENRICRKLSTVAGVNTINCGPFEEGDLELE